jgi:PAS domain S-box-containing protein
MLLLKKFLQPVYSLRETMKAVKEGDLNQQAPIISEDEVGDLTAEFNSMTKRLLQFEQSTLGQLLAERTKSITIVKNIADPIIVLDPNYKIALLNNACENVFNISEDKVLNKHFLEVINNGELYDYISSVYNSKSEDTDHKVIYLNVDDKDYYFNIIVSVLKNAQEKAAGMVVLFQNITQLKQIEKIKSDFVATISHEFKTPLTSIMIGTSLVKDEKLGVLSERQREVIDTIAEDSERLLELVNDLLNLSKLESGKSIFDIKPNSIEGIIDKSVKCFAEQAKAKNIYLHYRLEDKLPKVNVDAEKIIWTLNNLISNALRHTRPEDEVVVNAFVKQNKMCVTVTDTGEGIPKEYQEKVFDKFVQVPGQDSEMRGTGLGLAITREIIEAHGGEIWCISEFDQGSTFTFTLPIIEG